MNEGLARIGLFVPEALKRELMSILALEGMTMTAWLIQQMERTVREHKAMRGERE